MAEYDVIVVGGGSNGLACAGYFVNAGLNTLVLERRDIVGGGATTEELCPNNPGFKFNVSSIQIIYIPETIQETLQLKKYGCEFIKPDPMAIFPFTDGNCIPLYNDLNQTVEELERFSMKDAKAYRKLYDFTMEVFEVIGPAMLAPPIPNSALFKELEESDKGREFLRYMLTNPMSFVNEWFENEYVKAMFCGMSIWEGVDPRRYYCGDLSLIVPAIHMTGFPLVKGGSGEVTKAIAKFIEANDGTIRTNAEVRKFIVKDKEAKGVILADGEEIMAKKAVVANLAAKQVFLQYMDPEHLDSSFIRRVERIKAQDFVPINVHVALKEPPYYTAYDNKPCAFCLTGDTLEYIQKSFDDITYGIPSQEPVLFAGTPTVDDPSQAPPGKHTLYLYSFTPYRLKEASWDDKKFQEQEANRLLNKLRKFAPNVTKDQIIDYYVNTPLEIERRNISMIGASSQGIENTPDQRGWLRPTYDLSQYKTPINKLFLTGPGTWPGGGVRLIAGHNTAQVVLEELGGSDA